MANAAIILTATDKTQAAFNNAQRNLDALTGAASRFNAALAGVGLGVSLQAIGQMADDYASLQARLKLASRSAEEFAAANEAVQRIAAASSAPLLETATLYTRIASSLKDTSVSQAEMVGTTEAVALSLRISGASAAEASSAMLQFSQAVASGVLRGEEFNAVNESAPRLMQALAKSLGVSVGALRDMAKEGQLTRDVLINGLARQLPELRREAESLPKTLGATFTDLNNKLLLTVGQIDKITGASNGLAQAFDKIGKPLILTTFQTLGVVGANVAYVFNQVGKEIGGIAAQLAALATGNFREAGIIGDIMKRDAALARKELDDIERRIMGLGGKTQAAAAAAGKAASERIPLPTAKTGKSGKTAKTKENPLTTQSKADALRDYQLYDLPAFEAEAAEFEAIIKRSVDDANEQFRMIDGPAFDAEGDTADRLRAMREQYIDLIDPVEKYRRKLDEIAQLQEAGLLTKEQATEATYAINEQIDGLNQVNDTLREQKSIADELGLTFSSAFEDAVIGGKSFSEVLKGIEKDIARIIIRKSVTEPLGNAISGIFSGINWGNIFGFGGGKASGGAVYPGQYYVVGEKGPEVLLPNTAGTVVPNNALGGGVTIVQNISVDSRSDRASILAAMSQAKDMAKAEILNSMQRGGTYARATGRA